VRDAHIGTGPLSTGLLLLAWSVIPTRRYDMRQKWASRQDFHYRLTRSGLRATDTHNGPGHCLTSLRSPELVSGCVSLSNAAETLWNCYEFSESESERLSLVIGGQRWPNTEHWSRLLGGSGGGAAVSATSPLVSLWFLLCYRQSNVESERSIPQFKFQWRNCLSVCLAAACRVCCTSDTMHCLPYMGPYQGAKA